MGKISHVRLTTGTHEAVTFIARTPANHATSAQRQDNNMDVQVLSFVTDKRYEVDKAARTRGVGWGQEVADSCAAPSRPVCRTIGS